MKRKHFLILSAVVAWAFGLGMMFAPDQFTSGTMVLPPTAAVNAWATFMGSSLFSFGVINIFAAGSPWNRAVQGVLLGNIMLHLLGVVFDGIGYSQNIVTMQALMQGTVVHLVLIAGFAHYAFRKSTRGVEVA